nr:uncharacterized protein LOC127304853 [Lolium perenne]XP_051191387.1 uncharacterized protein LOC127304853 [Lolium perenne]
MKGRDYFLLASRTVCTALAVASFSITPLPSMRNPILGAFISVKAVSFLQMFMGLLTMGLHVSSLRNWMDGGPNDYFSYPAICIEGVLAAANWGSATAALAVITHPRHLPICLHNAPCRRQMLACALALPMGALSVANVAVLLAARVTSNGPRLLMLLFGH